MNRPISCVPNGPVVIPSICQRHVNGQAKKTEYVSVTGVLGTDKVDDSKYQFTILVLQTTMSDPVICLKQ